MLLKISDFASTTWRKMAQFGTFWHAFSRILARNGALFLAVDREKDGMSCWC
jgi:hypothetical protein